MADDCGHRKCAAPLLFLLAAEASERQTVVAGGVVRPLVVEAYSGGIPTTGGCPVQAKAGKASSGGTLEVGRSQRWWGACCFSQPVRLGMTDNCGHRRRAAHLLFLSATEASQWQNVVTGGVMRPLAVEASSGGIPPMME